LRIDFSVCFSRGAVEQVNEISTSGDIAQLKSTALPVEAPPGIKSDAMGDARTRLSGLVGEPVFADIDRLASGGSGDASLGGATATKVQTGPLDKDARKQVHELVRACFPQLDSAAGQPVAAHAGASIIVFPRAVAGDKRSRNSSRAASGPGGRPDGVEKLAFQQWPAWLPDYLCFTLHKRNADTQNAVLAIADAMHVNPSLFSFAGRKDRRGCTSQLVTARRVLAKRLAGLNHFFRGDIVLGNFFYTPEKLWLGKLRGNRFSLVIRDVASSPQEVGLLQPLALEVSPSAAGAPLASEVSPSAASGSVLSRRREAASAALSAWQSAGFRFINYFGLQRFGNNGDAGTHAVGCALLRRQWKTAVHLILHPRSGEPPAAAAARALFASTGDAKRALAALPRHMRVEWAVLDALARQGPDQYEAACAALPPHARMLFIHAYQSVLWNKCASARVSLGGTAAPIVGDLVLVDVTTAITTEGDVVEDDDADGVAPADDGVTDASLPAVRMLTQADIDACTHCIDDVVIPLPGASVEVYSDINCGTAAVVTAMRMDGFDIGDDGIGSIKAAWKAVPRSFRVVGGYRNLIGRATDVQWHLLRHNGADEDLQLSDAECMLQMRSTVSTVKSCDEVTRTPGVSTPEAAAAPTTAAVSPPTASDVLLPRLTPAVCDDGSLLSLQLSFSLSKSCYATMALRELMKCRTERPANPHAQHHPPEA
jgi:tRNA pseudouridine13 synthase